MQKGAVKNRPRRAKAAPNRVAFAESGVKKSYTFVFKDGI